MADSASKGGRTGAVITVLTVVFLGAMAFAIPPAPIDHEGEAGLLVSHAALSDRIAEHAAMKGYGFLAVDLTTASLEKGALWRRHLDAVTARRFPVWGWIHTRAGADKVLRVSGALAVAGLFVDGSDSLEMATLLRAKRPSVRVVPVVRSSGAAPSSGEYAVAADADAFLRLADGSDRRWPVLAADRLPLDRVEDLRDRAEGRYVVSQVPLSRD